MDCTLTIMSLVGKYNLFHIFITLPYLDALNQNVAQYMHSGSKPCKAAGAGEYPIGVSFDYRAVE